MTYKSTIELFSIPKIINVKFGVIMSTDANASAIEKQKWDKFKLVNMFKYNNNEYIKISPHPFLSIDIGGKKEYDYNNNFTLNQRDLFLFIMNLKSAIADFTNHKDLFLIDNDEVVVNKELAQSIKKVFRTTRKTLLIEHAPVLRGENDNLITYEGVILAVNHLENFTTFTYAELKYLLWELEKIDMINLSLQLISIDASINGYSTNDEKVIEKEPISEKIEDEIIDTKSSFFVRNYPTLPPNI